MSLQDKVESQAIPHLADTLALPTIQERRDALKSQFDQVSERLKEYQAHVHKLECTQWALTGAIGVLEELLRAQKRPADGS